MGDREEFLQIFQQHVTRPGSEKLLDLSLIHILTDGTPAACYQKNAEDYLQGDVSTSVMAQYGQQLFGTAQHTHSADVYKRQVQQLLAAGAGDMLLEDLQKLLAVAHLTAPYLSLIHI